MRFKYNNFRKVCEQHRGLRAMLVPNRSVPLTSAVRFGFAASF